MAKHPHNYKIVLNPKWKDVKKTFDKLDRPVGLDIETAQHEDYRKHPKAGLDPQLSHIRLIQVAIVPNVYVFDVWALKKADKTELLDFIRKKEFFAHFAQFEAAHFQAAGVKKLKVHCTQIMYRMLVIAETFIEDSKNLPAGLDAVVQDILKITVDKSLQTSDWNAEVLTEEQIKYAARDATYCDVLGPAFLKKVTETMPLSYDLNKRMINPVARMSRNGFFFDVKAHTKLVKNWVTESDKLKKRLKKKYGDMNFNSYKQIGNLIREHFPKKVVDKWPLTASGKNLKTDADTLSDFAHIPGFKDLGGYKPLQKLISTYGEGLIEAVNPITKRIHAGYSLGYTVTDRLSSFKPNMQNMPRPPKDITEPSVRKHFRHQYKKTVIVGADYSQIEAKIAALLSGDPELLKVFRTDKDFYAEVAARALGLRYEDISKDSDERRIGKSAGLGLLYGMGWRAFKLYTWVNYRVELSDTQAQNIHAAFFEWLSVYRQWQKDTAEEAAITLITKTRLGKIRKLNSKRYYTCSMNTPNQGSAAEIMKSAFIRVDNALRKKKLKARIVNQIHDEIDTECFLEDVDEVVHIVKTRMIRGFKDVFPDTMGIKELVDVKVGKNWAAIK